MIYTKAVIQCDVCRKVAPAILRVNTVGGGINFMSLGMNGATMTPFAAAAWHGTEHGYACSADCAMELSRAVEQLLALPIKDQIAPYIPNDRAIPDELLRYIGKDV